MDSQEDHIEGGQVLGQPDLHPLKPQAVQDCSARGPLLSPSLAPHRGAEQDWSSRKIQIFKGLQPVEVAGLGGLASRARTSQVLHFLRLCETVGCHVSEESTTSQASAKVLTLERTLLGPKVQTSRPSASASNSMGLSWRRKPRMTAVQGHHSTPQARIRMRRSWCNKMYGRTRPQGPVPPGCLWEPRGW